ncbi:Gfo/Idh/MocA family oxidoreductase [Streptomyces sp. NPDC086519]|uniref:Gfo/Idh/MocA family protein n=1 Tax=Streptomyces sp. NPDC086519 TaxID=3154863 RepID=UPI003412229F
MPGDTLRVALVGHAFMGASHSQAWRTAPHFFDMPLAPEQAVLVGRDAERAAQAARRLGWQESATDWRQVVQRDDIDLVDICTPGDTHAEIAVAALAAGKHVLCEKPLANTVAQAEEMTTAARKASGRGIRSMVGFTYRRVPAVGLARQFVAEGRIGRVRHVRAQYLQDWLADPATPMSWRLEKDRAGSGALGDIGSHIVDMAQYLTGERLTGVSALTETFVDKRPLPDGTGSGKVTVDDAAVFLSRLDGGGLATFEATRFALGRKNALRIEINGDRGSLAFDFEDMNVLHYLDGTDPTASAGFRRVVATEPEHPYVAAWWPPGHGLGYEHGFTHQVVDLITAIAQGADPEPSFDDALQVQRVLESVEHSAAHDSQWTAVQDRKESR